MKTIQHLLLGGAAIASLLVAKKSKSVSGVGSYGGELDYEAAREIYIWFENTAVVYGYLLGTNQCTTAGEAYNEFFNDVYENLGF